MCVVCCSNLVLEVPGVPLGQRLDRGAGNGVAGEGSEDVELDAGVVGLYCGKKRVG